MSNIRTKEELLEKVEMIPIAGCWIWTGSYKKGFGYGWIQHKRKFRNAHRIFWELFNGEIGDSKIYVLHRCDNPACVNPSHLFLGSHKTNMEDKAKKGRSKSGIHYGMKRMWSKLTEDQVKQIRVLLSEKVLQKEIAKMFSVSKQTISAIKNGVNWNA